jgi:CheY-like chemotaxis protein
MQVPSFEQLFSEASIAAIAPNSGGRTGTAKSTSPEGFSSERRIEGKKTRNRVMIVGRIRELALYRAEVLRHEGFQVSTPGDREEAIAIIRSGGFDIAVLSYTLPSTLVQELADEVREHCPECRIIAIADSNRIDRRINPDAVALAEEGPPALVRAVRKLSR